MGINELHEQAKGAVANILGFIDLLFYARANRNHYTIHDIIKFNNYIVESRKQIVFWNNCLRKEGREDLIVKIA